MARWLAPVVLRLEGARVPVDRRQPRGTNSQVREQDRSVPTLVEKLTSKARTLRLEDRERLAEDLLASLEDASEPTAEIEAAWEHEIQRRVEEVKRGAAKLVPAEEVYAETRRIYRK